MAIQRKKSKHALLRARSAARLAAVQALFQIEQTQASPGSVIIEFIEHRLGNNIGENDSFMADSTFFSELVRRAWEEKETLDQMISGCLRDDWKLERIESVTRAILRSGTYELLHSQDTPTPVIINEYLELTRAFYDDKVVAFVNGVLDRLAKVLRSGNST